MAVRRWDGAVPARPAQVRDLSTGREADLPPVRVHAALPIGLFRIHEKALIEPADLVHHLTPHEQARADDEINRALLVVLPAVVIAELLVLAKGRRESEVLHPRTHRRREPPARDLQGARRG
jgi:hypothetical protein